MHSTRHKAKEIVSSKGNNRQEKKSYLDNLRDSHYQSTQCMNRIFQRNAKILITPRKDNKLKWEFCRLTFEAKVQGWFLSSREPLKAVSVEHKRMYYIVRTKF